jgi:uncharacterized membrane protein
MSKTFHHGERGHGHRKIRVRGIRREVPDYRKLARALIALAQAQAEAEAEAADVAVKKPTSNKSKSAAPPPVVDPKNQEEGDAA